MKVQATSYAEAYEATPRESRPIELNLEGYYPSLDGAILSLLIPSVHMEGPLFSEGAILAMQDAGLTSFEIDSLVDKVFAEIEMRQLARVLIERRRK